MQKTQELVFTNIVLDGVPATSISKGLTRLAPKANRATCVLANYIVEASISTIILFCVIHKDVDIYINDRHFGPKAFIRARFENLVLMKAFGLKRLPFI